MRQTEVRVIIFVEGHDEASIYNEQDALSDEDECMLVSNDKDLQTGSDGEESKDSENENGELRSYGEFEDTVDIKMEESEVIKVEDNVNMEVEDIKMEDTVDMKIDDIMEIKVEDTRDIKISDASNENDSGEQTLETNAQSPVVIGDNDSEKDEVESGGDQEVHPRSIDQLALRHYLPNVNHPDKYCEPCRRHYKKKCGLREHIRRHHRFDPDTISTAGQPLDCVLCGVGFSEQFEYRLHLRNTHRLSIHIQVEPNLNISPDPEDPNFYCRSCRLKLKDVDSYKIHLTNIHHLFKALPHVQIRQRIFMDPNVQPDINDPNSHCRKCDRTYKDRQSYRAHLFKKHRDLVASDKVRRPVPTPGIEPDIHDPNNYCHSCNYTFTLRASYNSHLKKKHNVHPDLFKLRRPVPTPGVEPDIKDPNFHCRSCNFTYTQRSGYNTHLKRTHKLELGNTRLKRRPSIIYANYPLVDRSPSETNTNI